MTSSSIVVPHEQYALPLWYSVTKQALLLLILPTGASLFFWGSSLYRLYSRLLGTRDIHQWEEQSWSVGPEKQTPSGEVGHSSFLCSRRCEERKIARRCLKEAPSTPPDAVVMWALLFIVWGSWKKPKPCMQKLVSPTALSLSTKNVSLVFVHCEKSDQWVRVCVCTEARS